MNTVYLSLGSNIGDRRRTVEMAIEYIKAMIGEVVHQSSLYETKPWGFESPNDFINAAVCVETTLTPNQLLDAILKIEKRMGRTLKSENGVYHDRTIDIDILLYDDIKVKEPGLCIPHPHMLEREFVMKPLLEIFPDFDADRFFG